MADPGPDSGADHRNPNILLKPSILSQNELESGVRRGGVYFGLSIQVRNLLIFVTRLGLSLKESLNLKRNLTFRNLFR